MVNEGEVECAGVNDSLRVGKVSDFPCFNEIPLERGFCLKQKQFTFNAVKPRERIGFMNILSRFQWTRVLFTLLILAMISSCAGRENTASTPASQSWSQSDLEQIVENWRLKTNIPGVVVGISQPSQANIIIVSGVSSIQEGTPISETAQFRIASIVKTLSQRRF